MSNWIPPGDKPAPVKSALANAHISLTRVVNLASTRNDLCEMVVKSLEEITKQNTDSVIIEPLKPSPPVMTFGAPPANPNVELSTYGPMLQQSFLFTGFESSERIRIRKRLDGFEAFESDAWKTISARFGFEIRQSLLCEVAKQISTKLSIPLDRDAKRRKSVLIKWFNDHWNSVSTELPYYSVVNDQVCYNPDR